MLGDLVAVKHCNGISVDDAADPFDSAEGQIPFTSFDTTDVGPMKADCVSEGLLGQTLGLAVSPDISPKRPLEISVRHILDDGSIAT